jgi:hypothetical protein
MDSTGKKTQFILCETKKYKPKPKRTCHQKKLVSSSVKPDNISVFCFFWGFCDAATVGMIIHWKM